MKVDSTEIECNPQNVSSQLHAIFISWRIYHYVQAEPVVEALVSSTWPALVLAAGCADVLLVNAILATNPDINAQEPYMGRTALHFAVAHGHTDVVKRLLDGDADRHVLTFKGLLPLQVSVIYDHREIMTVLLERGCNPNHQSPNGTTALHAAAANGRHAVAKILLDFGADRNISDGNYTPLQFALFKSDTEMARILLMYNV